MFFPIFESVRWVDANFWKLNFFFSETAEGMVPESGVWGVHHDVLIGSRWGPRVLLGAGYISCLYPQLHSRVPIWLKLRCQGQHKGLVLIITMWQPCRAECGLSPHVAKLSVKKAQQANPMNDRLLGPDTGRCNEVGLVCRLSGTDGLDLGSGPGVQLYSHVTTLLYLDFPTDMHGGNLWVWDPSADPLSEDGAGALPAMVCAIRVLDFWLCPRLD